MTPETNTRLFGHEEAEARLFADAANYRLPHGLIISGPRGIGKATLAYRFARALLAGEPAPDMDDTNPVFRRVSAGSHPDLLVISPLMDEKKGEEKRDISVEQARGIAQFLSLTPGEGDWRVVIVDSVDALNANAANAILKILEEPPPQAMLLLISHNPGRLLPTIRSRCQMLKLAPLSGADFSRAMHYLLPEADEEKLSALSLLSAGAPGLASELEEQGACDMYEQILSLLSTLPELNSLALHGFAEQINDGSRHANWQLLTRLMLVLFERAAKHASGMQGRAISFDEPEVLAKLASLHPPAIWAAKWQQACDQFSLADRLHLDYKQTLIAFFHSIASPEGFQLGNAAA